MKSTFFQVLLCLIFANSLSLTWSSSVNSLFSARSYIPTAELSAEIIESIASGTQVALEECQKAFRWDRWNCPETIFTRKHQQEPTRETAYAQAIISAGIVHTITRNCSKGQIDGCGCDPKLSTLNKPFEGRSINQQLFNQTYNKSEEITWTWGGCSDHVNFGVRLAEEFAADFNGPQDAQSVIRQHNHQMGRQMVKDTMVKRCTCHGVSGSCALQTCWMQVAPFAMIARKLKEKYHKSKHIDTFENYVPEVTLPQIDEINSNLLYLVKSPNYCLANKASGWPGTKGRVCSRNKDPEVEPEECRSCRNLCKSCGYKVRKLRKVVSERCNCKFQWCCEVQCETCQKTVEEFHCL